MLQKLQMKRKYLINFNIVPKNTEENALHAISGFLILEFQKYISSDLVGINT